MSLTITLPPAAEARLEAEAREQGIAPEALALQTLLERFEPVAHDGNGASRSTPPEQELGLTEEWTAAQETEREALVSALPAEWRQFIGKYDSSLPETDEQKREREKVWERAGVFGEIVDEKYRKRDLSCDANRCWSARCIVG